MYMHACHSNWIFMCMYIVESRIIGNSRQHSSSIWSTSRFRFPRIRNASNYRKGIQSYKSKVLSYINMNMYVYKLIVIYLYVCVGYSEPYHNHLIFIQSKSVHLHPPLVGEWVGDLIHQTPRHLLLEMLTTPELDRAPRLKQVVRIRANIYIYKLPHLHSYVHTYHVCRSWWCQCDANVPHDHVQ